VVYAPDTGLDYELIIPYLCKMKLTSAINSIYKQIMITSTVFIGKANLYATAIVPKSYKQ
jgi:hypothetical protein